MDFTAREGTQRSHNSVILSDMVSVVCVCPAFLIEFFYNFGVFLYMKHAQGRIYAQAF